MNVKVLVTDLTHGGEVLVRRYAELGHEVTALDIYRTPMDHGAVEACGARVLLEAPEERFDLAVSPIHCPDGFIGDATFDRRLTYHQAVGELISPSGRWVEVTGVRGKTSTCHLTSHLLTGMGLRVLKLTSSGLELHDGGWKVLKDKVSIAPTTLLEVDPMGIDYDVAVMEVSLGGSGKADLGVITNVGDGYAIAGGTRTAFEAKLQMLAGDGKRLVPEDELEMWAEHRSDLLTHRDELIVDGYRLGERTRVRYRDSEVELDGSYLVPSYLKSMSCALAIVDALDLSRDEALRHLSTFRGVRGRGEVHPREGGFLIRERNPGVSAASIDHLLTSLERYGVDDAVLALEPVNRKVCEKLVLDDVAEVLASHRVPGFLLDRHGKEHPALPPIEELSELDGHEVIVHCTKEGYL